MNKSKWDKERWLKIARAVFPYIVILIAIQVMLSYQTNAWATYITSDRFLHFNRFYDMAMQIKTGNYSYFQTNYGFNQSGRIFNALYGPFFVYLNGLLLLACRTWYNFDITTMYIVFLLGGIGMYQLSKKAKVNTIISILTAIIYLQFGIIVGIIRYNFMAWGSAIAPFVMIQAVNMVQDRKRPIYWLQLGLIMALAAQIHLLTTVILPFTLLPFAVYGLYVTPNKKQMIIDFFKAVGGFILMTANIWGAFLLVYRTNKISVPNTFHMDANAVQYDPSIFIHGKMNGLLIILLLLQIIWVAFHFRKSALNSMATVFGGIIMIFSSIIVPWAKVQAHFPKLGQIFQFPYRLTIGAIPLMLMGVGISLTQLMNTNVKIVKDYAIMAVVLTLMEVFAGTVRQEYVGTTNAQDPSIAVGMVNYYTMTPYTPKIRYATQHTNNGYLFKLITRAEPDYLPVKTSADNLLYDYKIIGQQHRYKRIIKDSQMTLVWKSKKNGEKRLLPIVMYHQSRLIVNGKNATNSPKNQICMPTVTSKKGTNTATLSFIVPIWFWLLVALSLLSWIGYLAYFIWLGLKKRNGQNQASLA